MKQIKGSLMLLLAAFIWGTTFVAQTSAKDAIGTFTFNASRSFVGAAFLAILVLLRRRNKAGSTSEKKSVVICGFICGVVLFIAVNLQQGGIVLYPEGVAASGRAGFLTATYVVMVAVCSRLLGKKLHKLVYAAIAFCLLGMYFLCMSGGIDSVYTGDLLELLCAVFFTIHILVIDRFAHCDSVKLSCVQFLTTGVLSTVAMFIVETPDVHSVVRAIFPILYAGIFSSGIAYTLQMAGQKYTQPAIASIIMSLESVFAMLGGWVILGERLSSREFAGCMLVFGAVILAQLPGMLPTQKISHKTV